MSERTSLTVVTTDDQREWQRVLDEVEQHDFYHLRSCHRLAEINDEGVAVMPVYEDKKCLIAFPMILRDIDLSIAAAHEKGLKDATCVYGYPGPISSSEISTESRMHFAEAMHEFYTDNRIICAFSRLHPLFDQSSILEGFGETIAIGSTVSMDLTLPEDTQLACYHSDQRRIINKMRSEGVTCNLASGNCLDDFINIYYESMDHLRADPSYYFNRQYFEYILQDMCDVSYVMECRINGEIACASLNTLCNGIIQGHLAGVATKYRKSSPMKIMLDAVRRHGNAIGAHTFHIGGGLGGKRDSLFEFKKGFASNEHEFRVWRYIADPKAYAELSNRTASLQKSELSDEFFPAYRDPTLMKSPESSEPISQHLHVGRTKQEASTSEQ